jgi:hypothetical protein
MSGETTPLREALTEGIRYWEPRRIIYNLVLLAIVGIHALRSWFGPGFVVDVDIALWLFLLWVLANVAYCAAYLVEIPAQLSGFRQEWVKIRFFAFLVGLAFAGILAHYFSMGLLGPDI